MLKLMEFFKSSPTRAAFTFEGETAELDELLRRAATMTVLGGAAPVLAPAEDPDRIAQVVDAALSKAVAAPVKSHATPAKQDWVSPPTVLASAADAAPLAPVKEPEPAGAKDPAPEPPAPVAVVAPSTVPETVLAEVKFRPALKAVADMIQATGTDPTVKLIVDWCIAHQAQVPLLAGMGDTMAERASRTAQLIVPA
jgi:hypothetical protein